MAAYFKKWYTCLIRAGFFSWFQKINWNVTFRMTSIPLFRISFYSFNYFHFHTRARDHSFSLIYFKENSSSKKKQTFKIELWLIKKKKFTNHRKAQATRSHQLNAPLHNRSIVCECSVRARFNWIHPSEKKRERKRREEESLKNATIARTLCRATDVYMSIVLSSSFQLHVRSIASLVKAMYTIEQHKVIKRKRERFCILDVLWRENREEKKKKKSSRIPSRKYTKRKARIYYEKWWSKCICLTIYYNPKCI